MTAGLMLIVLHVPLAVRPDPGTARDWMRDELSKADYRPSLTERFRDWVDRLFAGLRGVTDSSGGLQGFVAIGLLVLLLALLTFVLSRLRANAAPRPGEPVIFAETRLTAEAHRALARRAMGAGDWDDALVESTRALAAGLFERDLLAENPGATAHELADLAGRTFPTYADRLDRGARLFDETLYGGHPADEPRARELMDLEDAVRRAAPDRTARTGPVAPVPR